MDTSKVLFRCSALGKLMTEPKLKVDKEKGNLSEGAKSYVVEVYVTEKYKRHQDFTSKYLEKGLMVEEDSITLYSRIKKEFFQKNEDLLKNEFIKGTPDIFVGETIHNAEVIIDIKSSWDIFTFFKNYTKDVKSDYYWQLQGYMALTGAKKSRLAYCLVNTPQILIDDEKRRLMYKMNVATDENEHFKNACDEMDFSMIYDDIPFKNRLLEFEIDRDDEAIQKIYTNVAKAREFLFNLDKQLE
jgi:hypothetical protein